MSERSMEMVPVRRDVLAELQAAAAAHGQTIKYAAADEVLAFPSTAKSVAAPIGAGAVLAFVATMDDIKNSETIKKNWWLLPAAVLLVGYVLRRRNSPHANAVLAAGAVLFVQAWRNRPPEKKESAQAPAPPPVKPAGDTAGPAVMHPIDDRTAWIQSGGQWVRVQLAAPVRPALPMSTLGPQMAAPAQAVSANVSQDAAAQLAAAAFAA